MCQLMKSLLVDAVKLFLGRFQSLICNCYPDVRRLVLETKELEISVLRVSERFINQ